MASSANSDVGRTQAWAQQVVESLSSIISDHAVRRSGISVHAVRAPAPDVIEVLYSWAGDEDIRGIRLEESALRNGSEFVRTMAPLDVATYLKHVGICEPRSIDEYKPADPNQIRWLPFDAWLGDL